jgi:hypothetical protein
MTLDELGDYITGLRPAFESAMADFPPSATSASPSPQNRRMRWRSASKP